MIGLQAVAWLAGEDELLPVFLGSTGASEREFRENLQALKFRLTTAEIDELELAAKGAKKATQNIFQTA